MKVIAYYRCSTRKQDYSIDGQRLAVANFLASMPDAILCADYWEIESGRNPLRPQLLKAIEQAKAERAVLCVSRLDRLSRSTLHILTLLQQSKVQFLFCDAPTADFLQIGVMALISEREVQLISDRTKRGLQIARQRGVKLGNPRPAHAIKMAHIAIQKRKEAFSQDVLKVVEEIKATGIGTNYFRLAECLNRRGYVGRRGGAWSASTVRRLMLESAGA